MARVVINDALLDTAQVALGTSTKEATVEVALREVVAMRARSRAVGALVAWGQRNEPWDDGIRDRAWQH